MKEGKNTIRIVTKRISDSIFARQVCDVRFMRADPQNTNSFETLNGIYQSPVEADEYEVKFSVTCENKIQWLWESGDQIQDLTDADRNSIFKIIQKTTDAFFKKDVGLVRKHMIPVWGKGPCPEDLLPAGMNYSKMEEKNAEILQQIFGYSDYNVTIAKQKDLEYLQGGKTVMVTRKTSDDPGLKNSIIFAGHSPNFKPESGAMNWSISYDILHFLKIDKKWTMLVP